MKNLIFAAVTAALMGAAPLASAKNCTIGKACGNSCIPKNETCHVGQAVTSSVDEAINTAKECKNGKKCGDSCISKDAVCHKDGKLVAKGSRSRKKK